MKKIMLLILLSLFIFSIIVCSFNLITYEWVDNMSRRDLFINHWDAIASLLISQIGAYYCAKELGRNKRK